MTEVDITLFLTGTQRKGYFSSGPFVHAFFAVSFPANEFARLKLYDFKPVTRISEPELKYTPDL
jgi:hypothetical protein